MEIGVEKEEVDSGFNSVTEVEVQEEASENGQPGVEAVVGAVEDSGVDVVKCVDRATESDKSCADMDNNELSNNFSTRSGRRIRKPKKYDQFVMYR